MRYEIVFSKKVEPVILAREIQTIYAAMDLVFNPPKAQKKGSFDKIEDKTLEIETTATQQQIEEVITNHDYEAAKRQREADALDIDKRLDPLLIKALKSLNQQIGQKTWEEFKAEVGLES